MENRTINFRSKNTDKFVQISCTDMQSGTSMNIIIDMKCEISYSLEYFVSVFVILCEMAFRCCVMSNVEHEKYITNYFNMEVLFGSVEYLVETKQQCQSGS